MLKFFYFLWQIPYERDDVSNNKIEIIILSLAV